jgi:hypothetical protein
LTDIRQPFGGKPPAARRLALSRAGAAVATLSA